jgi:hypothetical protein
MPPAGLALPPPLILTSPQAATVDLLYSPNDQDHPVGDECLPRLNIASTLAGSSSPYSRSAVASLAPQPAHPAHDPRAANGTASVDTDPFLESAEVASVPVDTTAEPLLRANADEAGPSDPLSTAWRLFEKATPGLTSTRMPALLRALEVDQSSVGPFLESKVGPLVDVDTRSVWATPSALIVGRTAYHASHCRCRHLDTLFLMLMELNGDEAAATDTDWRPTVVEIFIRFFACLWDPKGVSTGPLYHRASLAGH